MSPHDVPLFAAFVLSEEGKKYHTWQFDVRVGPPTDPGPGYSPQARKDADLLSRVRIDAVGYDGLGPTLFEVKPDARLSAFGQILAYKFFFCRDRGGSCRAAIITDTCTPYCNLLYPHYDVGLHLVQPANQGDLLRAIKHIYPRSPLRWDDLSYLYSEADPNDADIDEEEFKDMHELS